MIPSMILYFGERVLVSGVEARLLIVDLGDLGDLAILLVLDLPKPWVLAKTSFLLGISTDNCFGLPAPS